MNEKPIPQHETNGTKFEVKINYESPLDLIEPNYPGNFPEQMPIYLEIDWERQEITAFTRDYNIGGTPAREWYGLATVYELPGNTRADQLAEWVKKEVIPRVEKLATKFESVWNGSNWVGEWKDDARDDLFDLEYFLDGECSGMGSIPTISDEGGLYHVIDWLENFPTADKYNITADTTDARLQEIADTIVSEAENDDVVLTGDVFYYLQQIREEMQG